MAECVYIDIEIAEPVLLSLELSPIYYVGTSQVGPQGQQGEKGDKGDTGEGIGDHETTYNHDEFVSSVEIDIIKVLTAAEYAALPIKSNLTMYVIVG